MIISDGSLFLIEYKKQISYSLGSLFNSYTRWYDGNSGHFNSGTLFEYKFSSEISIYRKNLKIYYNDNK